MAARRSRRTSNGVTNRRTHDPRDAYHTSTSIIGIGGDMPGQMLRKKSRTPSSARVSSPRPPSTSSTPSIPRVYERPTSTSSKGSPRTPQPLHRIRRASSNSSRPPSTSSRSSPPYSRPAWNTSTKIGEEQSKVVKGIVEMLRAKTMTRNSMKTWVGLFENGDGKNITVSDMQKMLRKFGYDISTADTEKVVEVFDHDGDGVLQYHELCDILHAPPDTEKAIYLENLERRDIEQDSEVNVNNLRPEKEEEHRLAWETNLKKEQEHKSSTVRDVRAAERVQNLETQLRGVLKRDRNSSKMMAELFRDFDVNLTGKLSQENFIQSMQTVLKRHGIRSYKKDMEQLMQRVDTNSDGQIQFSELYNYLQGDDEADDGFTQKIESAKKNKPSEAALLTLERGSARVLADLSTYLERKGYEPHKLSDLLRAFRHMKVTALHEELDTDEFRQCLDGLTGFTYDERDMNDFISLLDDNDDGIVSFGEFSTRLRQYQSWSSLDVNQSDYLAAAAEKLKANRQAREEVAKHPPTPADAQVILNLIKQRNMRSWVPDSHKRTDNLRRPRLEFDPRSGAVRDWTGTHTWGRIRSRVPASWERPADRVFAPRVVASQSARGTKGGAASHSGGSCWNTTSHHGPPAESTSNSFPNRRRARASTKAASERQTLATLEKEERRREMQVEKRIEALGHQRRNYTRNTQKNEQRTNEAFSGVANTRIFSPRTQGAARNKSNSSRLW